MQNLLCYSLALCDLSDFVIDAHNTRLRDVNNPIFPICNSAGVHYIQAVFKICHSSMGVAI